MQPVPRMSLDDFKKKYMGKDPKTMDEERAYRE